MDIVFLLSDYKPGYNELALDSGCRPVRYTLRLDGEKELSTKIIKSKSASVEIPELDLRILPGINSKDFVCDVLGLLLRIEDAVSRDSAAADTEKEVLLEKIAQLKNGGLKATFILIDPSGLSLVMGGATKEWLNT